MFSMGERVGDNNGSSIDGRGGYAGNAMAIDLHSWRVARSGSYAVSNSNVKYINPSADCVVAAWPFSAGQ